MLRKFWEKLVVRPAHNFKGHGLGVASHMESDDGSAITIKALGGVVLDGFSVQSAGGWSGDAGILVLSEDNVIRNNTARGSGNVGILLLWGRATMSHACMYLGPTAERDCWSRTATAIL